MICKKHNYSKINIGYSDSNDIDIEDMRKVGNESIKGLSHKCVAVKRRGCK